MNYFYYSIFILLLTPSIQGICNRAYRTHVDSHVARCLYSQEDIYRCYSKKVDCYGCQERRKECFFCGCPIEEHTKNAIVKKLCKKHQRECGIYSAGFLYEKRRIYSLKKHR